MSFKVGDRVEVLTPAKGAEYEPNKVGFGTVSGMDGEHYRVKVDSNKNAWWYTADQLRPLGTTEPTPKPSVKVGDQVRLTGVVSVPTQKRDGAVGVKINGAAGPADTIFVAPTSLEVIRQPFKRGEVVCDAAGSTFVAFNSEVLGKVDVVCCETGGVFGNADANLFQRREEN